jgi:SAM-dependent methyltransferase
LKCRHCEANVCLEFIDLGSAPPSNAYLTRESLRSPEKWYPLRVLVCPECWLVQTEDYADAHELFSPDYAYFSAYSTSWVKHAENYVSHVTRRFGLNAASYVVEVAANDGYLLQFVRERGIPCLGIEPTRSTAEAARNKGIEIVEEFFGVKLARQLVDRGRTADLTVANNVLAHVPHINDFVAGFAALLKPSGVATFEFPHLLQLVTQNQFDTVYHEHFSYLSFTAVARIFDRNGLTVFDVQEMSTHGGSLRVYAQRKDTRPHPVEDRVAALLEREREAGMEQPAFYAGLQARMNRVKDDLISFLIETKRSGKTIAGYGAAAKGNTLLNYAGVRADLLPFVVDANPAKQGRYLPGCRIPILAPEALRAQRPDLVLILPWNLVEEVRTQHSYIAEWDGRFVTAIPEFRVWECN